MAKSDEYYVGFYFKVEFRKPSADGAVEPEKPKPPNGEYAFQEVSGLSVQVGSMELAEGGENTFSHRLPNPVKYGNLVLKRATLSTENEAIVEWAKDATQNFTFTLRDVFVTLVGHDNQALKQWHFTNAYPVKYSVSNFNSTANSLVMDTLELSYQAFNQLMQAKSNP